MTVFGEGKALVDLLTRWRRWRDDRSDPARRQAELFISAFEAYGVQRQQIARLMPESVSLPSSTMSSPDRLKEKVSPVLLDWAAEFLALNRAWFDGVDPQPHLLIDGYKDTSAHAQWLRSRIADVPDRRGYLMVWKADAGLVNFESTGPIVVVYIEDSVGLDGAEFSRYWLLSREWPLGHPPCVECVTSLVDLARSLGLMMIGRMKPLRWLQQLEQGAAFAPEVARIGGSLWYPEDLVFGGGA
jgi:hypothetical protein